MQQEFSINKQISGFVSRVSVADIHAKQIVFLLQQVTATLCDETEKFLGFETYIYTYTEALCNTKL